MSALKRRTGVDAVPQEEVDGTIYPILHNAYDLGTSTSKWKDCYLSNDLYLDGDIITPTGTVTPTTPVTPGDVQILTTTWRHSGGTDVSAGGNPYRPTYRSFGPVVYFKYPGNSIAFSLSVGSTIAANTGIASDYRPPETVDGTMLYSSAGTFATGYWIMDTNGILTFKAAAYANFATGENIIIGPQMMVWGTWSQVA